MPILAIDHVQLAMPKAGEVEARAFYVGILGLQEVPKPPELAVRGGAWFEGPGVKIHLGVEEDFRPARKAHPALLVDDLAVFRQRFEQAQIAIREEPLPGYVRLFVADPFGNRLEIMQEA